MTDSEVDEFLVDVLKKILSDLEENREYEKSKGGSFIQDLLEDYDEAIGEVKNLVQKVTCVEDLADCGEEEVMLAFEFLESYAGNFVIASEEPQKSLDMKEYEKLDELLYLFYDADEDGEEIEEE